MYKIGYEIKKFRYYIYNMVVNVEYLEIFSNIGIN